MTMRLNQRNRWRTWAGALALLIVAVAAHILPLQAAGAVGAPAAAPAGEPLPQIVLVPTDVKEIVALVNMNIRHGPSTRYPIVGKLRAGYTTAVISRTADYGWWQVVCPVGVYGDCFISADSTLTRPTTAGSGILPTKVQWVVSRADQVVFAGPGSIFDQVGAVRAGEVARVLGISGDSLWWLIECTNTLSHECFISTTLSDPTGRPDQDQFPVHGTGVEFVMAQIDVPIYEGPGSNYLPAGLIYAGQIAQVTGISTDGRWWRVNCWETTARECYVSAHPSNTVPVSAPTVAPR